MHRYSQEFHDFVAANVVGRTVRELAALINSEFGIDVSESALKSYKSNHDLKSGTPSGVPAWTPSILFPAEVKQYIVDHYVGTAWRDLADQLNNKFGTFYTQQQIGGYLKNHKLNTGRSGRYQKGCIPNNGCIGTGERRSPGTEFKKGQRPHNWMPIGTEVVKCDGYMWRKMAEPNKWRQKHILVWEAANGPKPKGKMLICADGDKLNVSLDNLLLITKAQNAVMNKHGLRGGSVELTKAGIVAADIKMAITQLQQKRRKVNNEVTIRRRQIRP